MQDPNPVSQSAQTPPAVPGGYISAVEAAARFNLTNDHIASLCRKGKIAGTLVGRSRYVSIESLEAYIRSADEERTTRKAALSNKLKREYHERAPVFSQAPEEAPAEPQPVKSPFVAHEPHVYGLAFALGLFFVGAGYASGAWGGAALQLAGERAASLQRNVASGIVAVAELYPQKSSPSAWEPLMPAAAEKDGFKKQEKGTDVLGGAGSHTAALGNTLFMAAAVASARPIPVIAVPEAPSYASGGSRSGIVQTIATDKVISPVLAVASLPYLFITENLTRFASEVAAVHRGIAYAADALAEWQNAGYVTFVASAEAARDAYVASLSRFSRQSLSLADAAATAYGRASVAFVRGADDTAASQAQAYMKLASAAATLGGESVAYRRTVLGGVQLIAETLNTTPAFALRVDAMARSVEGSVTDAYASAVGGIGKAFVNGANAASDAYAAAVGAFSAQFVATAQEMPDIYAALVGDIGRGFVAEAEAAADAYAAAVGSAGVAFVRGADTAAGGYAAAVGGIGKTLARGADATASAYVAATGAVDRHPASPANAASVSLSAAGGFFNSILAFFWPKEPAVATQSNTFVIYPAPVPDIAVAPAAPITSAPGAYIIPSVPISMQASYPTYSIVQNVNSGVTEAYLTARLVTLTNYLLPKIEAAALSPKFSSRGGGGGGITSIPPLSDLSGLLGVAQGGTGLSSAPSYGQVLMGNSSGGYSLVATSSLGIAGGGALAALSDTLVSAPAVGNVLVYNGSKWANVATSSLGISGGTGSSFSYLFPANATTTGLGIYASTTIGGGALGLTVNGAATTTGNAYFGGNLYVGGYDSLESIFVQKSINNSRGVRYTISNTNTSGQSYAGAILYANNSAVASQFYADGLGTGPLGTPGFYLGNFTNHPIGFFTNNTEKMRLTADGNLAVGTTSPYARLTVWGASSSSGNALEIANSASTSLLTLSNAGVLSVGTNGSNAFTVDAATGSTTIANLSIGNLNFDTNAGVVALSNIPVDSNAAAGVIQSQSINIGDTSVLTAYGESDGSGGVQNLRVGIGTTSPYAALSVVGRAVASYFTAVTNATNTFPWLLSTGATTTSQYITGLAAPAGAFLAVDPFGKLIATTTPLSGGGASFSYLFPSNATSTALTFSGGIDMSNSNISNVNQLSFYNGATQLQNITNQYNQQGLRLKDGSTYANLFPQYRDASGSVAAQSGDILIATSTNVGISFYAKSLFSVLAASTTIGNATQATGLTISGGATTTGNAYFAGTVGIGVASPTVALDVSGTGAFTNGIFARSGTFSYTSGTGLTAAYDSSNDRSYLFSGNTTGSVVLSTKPFYLYGSKFTFTNNNSTSNFTVDTTGNVGIGTTSPLALLTVATPNGATGSLVNLFLIASSTQAGATTTLFTVTNSGNVGIGTTSPYAKLSVVGETVSTFFTATSTTATSTIAGGLNVGSGQLTYDFSSGITSINNLAVGAFNFDTDAGIVSWADLPISSNASAGTVESYTANVGGQGVLTVYGEADGSGGAQNLRIGIGTTTPWRAFSTELGTDQGIFSGTNAIPLTLERRTATANVGIEFRDAANSWFAGKDSNNNFSLNTSSNLASSPKLTLTTGGALTVASCSGCSSDQRLKKDIETLPQTMLEKLLALRPVSFRWAGPVFGVDLSTSTTQYGFIAQEAQVTFPNLVTRDVATPLTPGGTYLFNYEGLISPIVVAIQEMASITGVFRDNLIGWLANAANGITKLFAKEVHTDMLCVGDVCVTQDQFLAIVQASGVTPGQNGGDAPPSGDDDTASSTPPTPPEDNGSQASSTPPAPADPAPQDPAPSDEQPPADSQPTDQQE
ncbi:MAG TPA: tail fiber domain-containing protein [Candidatus Paceibacterota bacterium]|nr:tail fiber domain-containing protein [Candidatus Paceibacterota bacterium]